MLCDWNIERFVRKENYEYLNGLDPIKRFAEKFRLETEALKLKIEDGDEIAGWFYFDGSCDTEVLFDDETLDGETSKIISAPEKFKCNTNVDRGHTLVDYGYILKNGLVGYERKIDRELEVDPENEYLLAMKSSIKSTVAFLKRTSGDIKKMIGNSAENGRLCEFADMLCKVPFYPAENFKEAVQSVWIIHFLLPLAENAWYSISLGRFDEYMYPYYQKSVKNGMSVLESKSILRNFYRLLNSYADGACLLNVGPDYNELSNLIIECQKEFALPAPILGARVDKHTPSSVWDSLIDERLFSMGQPTFYGETPCTAALNEKGVSPEQARNFSNNSCMGISIAGKEFNSMWGCVFSVCSVLEAAVNKGRFLYPCDTEISGMESPESIEEVFSNFEECAEKLLEICVKAYEEKAEINERIFPDPFVSFLTEGCIEKHCDRISGAIYHNVTVECMGMINAADGICAIDRLVYKEKKYTLEEMCNAVKNNFSGYEIIKSDIEKCPKYGENSSADGYAVRVAEILQRVIRGFSHGNIIYSPSLHTLDHNVGHGMNFGATFDGRTAGSPFAKNAGPSNSVRSADPTSMVLSATKLPQYKFFGGQPVDVNFASDTVKNRKNEIRALAEVYFERGGLQFQVNSLSSALLRKAVAEPEKYRDLVVRIGGFSIYFNSLSQQSKEEFIERFEKEGH